MRHATATVVRAVVAGLSFTFVGCATTAAHPPSNPHYQKIVLSTDPIEQPLLDGPPQTAGMRSGRVVLKSGEDMHRHSTNDKEELLVFLQGKARVILGTETVLMEAGQVLYIPPHLEHEVHNDGPEELRYIFTVPPVNQ
jgi:mannose-6-phosphate isomerase-like protein (cupin superfamily)